jgi:hypothetical protein
MIGAMPSAGFGHRHNDSGTFDSICRECFMTIATESSESALLKYEQDHDCVKFAQQIFAVKRDELQQVFPGLDL